MGIIKYLWTELDWILRKRRILQTEFTSKILNIDEFRRCKLQYIIARKTGNYKQVDKQMYKTTKILIKNRDINKLKNIISEEIRAHEFNQNIMTQVYLILSITIVVPFLLDCVKKYYLDKILENPDISNWLYILAAVIITIAVFWLLGQISIEIVREDNTNFLKYYMKRLKQYEKMQNQQKCFSAKIKNATPTLDNTQNL